MNKKILVFDDDQEVLNALSDALDYVDWDLITVAEAGDALDLITKEQPHLVLMDVLMGDVDGRDVCKALKSNTHLMHIPVILISASGELTDTMSHEFGPNDIIEKPFNIGDLLDKVYFQLSL